MTNHIYIRTQLSDFILLGDKNLLVKRLGETRAHAVVLSTNATNTVDDISDAVLFAADDEEKVSAVKEHVMEQILVAYRCANGGAYLVEPSYKEFC